MILLSGAYRLFFPAAGFLAALAVPLWLAVYTGVDTATPAVALHWHMHEMLFGYLGAALAGFLLTALPNWTGRPALAGLPLLGLFLLWLLGRGVMLFWPAASILTLAFPVVLAMIATFELIASNNRRNMMVAALVWALTAAQATLLFGDIALAQRMGFGTALMLITLIGGRVTPAFSRNWLKAKGRSESVAEFGTIDKAALITTALTVLVWVCLGPALVSGALAILAASLLAWRVIRWNGRAVAREPLLLAMHLAYGWVALAFALLGLHILTGLITSAQVLHAMGAGAIGTMTLIIMIRALLGHSGRPITAGKWETLLLVLVHSAALLRVVAGGTDTADLLHLSGGLWSLGFGIFAIRYLLIALTPKH